MPTPQGNLHILGLTLERSRNGANKLVKKWLRQERETDFNIVTPDYIWFFGNSRGAAGVLKRSFSRVCPGDASSERALTTAGAGALARLARRVACQHGLKLRFSTPDHGNSQRTLYFRHA